MLYLICFVGTTGNYEAIRMLNWREKPAFYNGLNVIFRLVPLEAIVYWNDMVGDNFCRTNGSVEAIFELPTDTNIQMFPSLLNYFTVPLVFAIQSWKRETRRASLHMPWWTPVIGTY